MNKISHSDLLRWMDAFAHTIAENKDYLTSLDADIGDADHGINMSRGFNAVASKLEELNDKDIGTIFKTIAMTLMSTVGGASGPLYGTLFLEMAKHTQNKFELTYEEWVQAFQAGVEGIIKRGKAKVGDKTMLDSLVPASEAFTNAKKDNTFSNAFLQAMQAAEKGMLSTIPLVARKGRASYLGERSAGHQDPGATSSFMLIKAAVEGMFREK